MLSDQVGLGSGNAVNHWKLEQLLMNVTMPAGALADSYSGTVTTSVS